MTDDEREAWIRQDARGWNDKFLLRLLDEARASIRLRSADYSDGDRTVIVGQYTIDRLRKGEAVEIGPLPIILLGADDLCAPPEADVMERAKRLLYDGVCPNIIPGNASCDYPDCRDSLCEFWKFGDAITRALAEHGDQRAREAVEDDAWRQIARAVDARIDVAKREARAAAIEEAAQIADNYGREGDRLGKEYACETADEIAARIRALVDTPPQSEEGEG